ncbi:MAG TPA: ABC transporter ATP-binding protein [Gemmatimonadales bacterium]|nr:ABC transporter ATP-binding protein [Gemmatimonadales bacterium]
MTSSPLLELRSVTKAFGDFKAVDDLSLAVAPGEFLTFLGASGSGKTTTLRMIAGFELPTGGEILMEGAPITMLPPFKRDINTVFQHYALFPHMSVRENVGYGLRMRKVPAAEREPRVAQALEMVQLGALADRAPRQLSGGQQQRVALARALVNRPRVLLLDEPLGALDLKLRKEMQLELKQLNRKLGITFVYVTHDQEEALTMSDRIALMRNGRIEQLSPPQGMYEHPVSRYVADFIGESNLLRATVREMSGSDAMLNVAGSVVRARTARPWSVGAEGWLAVRPEFVRPARAGDGPNILEGTAADTVYGGSVTRQHLNLVEGGHVVFHLEAGAAPPAAGSTVRVTWPVERGSLVGD